MLCEEGSTDSGESGFDSVASVETTVWKSEDTCSTSLVAFKVPYVRTAVGKVHSSIPFHDIVEPRSDENLPTVPVEDTLPLSLPLPIVVPLVDPSLVLLRVESSTRNQLTELSQRMHS